MLSCLYFYARLVCPQTMLIAVIKVPSLATQRRLRRSSQKAESFPPLPLSLLLPPSQGFVGGSVYTSSRSTQSFLHRHRACKMPVGSLFPKKPEFLKSDSRLSHYIHQIFLLVFLQLFSTFANIFNISHSHHLVAQSYQGNFSPVSKNN